MEFVTRVTGALAGVWFKHEYYERPNKTKRDNEERLQKLYTPLDSHLKVNDLLWKDFKEELSKLGVATNREDNRKNQDVIQVIMASDEGIRKEAINLWISTMEGVFQYNNESAERIILQNLSYLTPTDAKDDSDHQKACLEYLRHVGEFRSIFHRWNSAKDTLITKGDWKDFHPTNPYPDKFSNYVKASKDKLHS